MKGVHSHINSHGGYILDLINKKDDSFLQGIGIRLAANEYGATTARPRRTGWTDALAARYAVNMSGPKVKLILTKPDCLSGADEFNIAYGYKDQNGSVVTSFPRREKELRNLSPIYRAYPGYGDISDITNYDNLPRTLRHAIGDFERYTGGDVVAVSVGAERDQTIIR